MTPAKLKQVEADAQLLESLIARSHDVADRDSALAAAARIRRAAWEARSSAAAATEPPGAAGRVSGR